LDLERLLPDLAAAYHGIETTFDEIEAVWSGTSAGFDPPWIELEINRSEMARLSHLDRAAVILMKSNLEKIASQSGEILKSVRVLKGLTQPLHGPSRQEDASPRVSPIDPDRIGATVKVVATLWIAFLIWVYVDPPGHAGFVQLSGTLALALVMMPQARPSMLFMPFAIGSAFAGMIYMLVMPKLAGYWELAAVLFAATFMIYFLFSEPKQGLSRLAGVVTLLVLTSVQNQQSYSFSHFANTTAMLLLLVAFLTALSYIPNSPRPEKVFIRLMSRYAHCSARLLDRSDWTARRKGWFGRKWGADLYRSNLHALPTRLGQVCQGIDFHSLSPDDRERIQTLLTSIHTLNSRIFAIEEAHRHPPSGELSTGLHDEVAALRRSLVKLLHDWDNEKPSDTQGDLSERLRLALAGIEARVESAFTSLEGSRLSDDSYMTVYRLLGSYRGLAEAVVAYAKACGGIDWSRWREARF
jgi:hypothetical protein